MSLRFRYRHVHRTVASYVEAELRALGWRTAADVTAGGAVLFGASAFTYLNYTPEENGVAVVANTVCITLGDEPSASDEELGDGLRSLRYPVFVDVYGDNQAIALSVASDAKTLFEDRYMPVTDFTGGDPGVASPEYLEFDKDDALLLRPATSLVATDFRRHWRIVKAMATVHYVQS